MPPAHFYVGGGLVGLFVPEKGVKAPKVLERVKETAVCPGGPGLKENPRSEGEHLMDFGHGFWNLGAGTSGFWC